jgi:SH3-like domain-containing protein
VCLGGPAVEAQTKVGEAALTSGLAVPRFVSIKPSRVNLRSGPGTEYPTTWVYKREGLPLEIIKEFEAWRQVRDSEGSTGWVLQHFLSGRRTALIASWEVKPGVPPPQIALFADESESARKVATVEAGVIANVLSCNGRWCYVSIENYRGYIQQKTLWGVYEAEVVK